MSRSTIFQFPPTPRRRAAEADPSTFDSNSARPGGLAAPDPESLLVPRLACAALAGLAAVQLILPGAGAPTQIDFRAARRPRPVAAPPLPEYPAILRSPLFAPDRRPGDVAPATASGQGASLDGFTALGVVVGGAAAAAVISGPNVGAQAVKRGEKVNGWRLAVVSPTAAVFERGGVRQTLVVGAPASPAAATGDPDASGGLGPAANAMPENAPQGMLRSRRK